jgi:hypothetical protein
VTFESDDMPLYVFTRSDRSSDRTPLLIAFQARRAQNPLCFIPGADNLLLSGAVPAATLVPVYGAHLLRQAAEDSNQVPRVIFTPGTSPSPPTPDRLLMFIQQAQLTLVYSNSADTGSMLRWGRARLRAAVQ